MLIKAPPPRNSEEALERSRELRKLSDELRKQGRGDLADRLDAVARALGNGEADGALPGLSGSDARRIAASGMDRYPVRYQRLLAEYFDVDPGQEDKS
jgi:hypothetical protein